MTRNHNCKTTTLGGQEASLGRQENSKEDENHNRRTNKCKNRTRNLDGKIIKLQRGLEQK